MKPFKKLLSNALDNPRTTLGGVLALVGLFTPVSPVIIAAAGAVAMIFGAADPSKAPGLPGDKTK